MNAPINKHKLKDIKIGDKVLVDDNIAEVHKLFKMK